MWSTGHVRVEPLDPPVVQRNNVVLDRFDQKQPLQFLKLLGVFFRDVSGLGPVIRTVQLPGVILEGWQWDLVRQAPASFVRGCIRSDGCVFINRTGPYEYLSYDFSNKSREIVELFAAACDLLGVEYRLTGANSRRGLWDVRINRRASVALMLDHVGMKS